ncbi:glycosyltransferase family 39 protein [Arthrobacter sp. 35W]|uniref:glycosyltransferase family 39 protein n=1 Tax=Arthrobacter sp. 35W TaxID=1132441 RepID=UPI00047A966C|nr:glycosyltransferase family 39 protein [Arthrobacter sp. 35W]
MRTHRRQVLVTFAVAVLAFFISPWLVPNRAFQLLATVAAGTLVWDAKNIRRFYRSLFSIKSFELTERIGGSWLLRVPQLAFCAIIGIFLVGILFSPIDLIWAYNVLAVSLSALAICLLIPTFHRASGFIGRWLQGLPGALRWSIGGALMVALATVQTAIGHSVQFVTDWDAGMIFKSAAALATGEASTLDEDYYSMYPNNIMLALVLKEYLTVMHALQVPDLYLSAIVANAVVMTVSVLLTFLVARRMAGYAVAVFAMIPCAVFIGISPWISVPYSDTLGMIFPILLVYLFLLARSSTRPAAVLALWAAMGLVAVVGFFVKPTVIFVLIAAVAVNFLTKSIKRDGFRPIAFAALSTVVALAAFFAGSTAIKTAETNSGALTFNLKDNDKEFPATHFLKMGAQGLGGFNVDDVIETKAIEDPSERFQNGIDVYAERVGEMGPWGYVNFLFDKGKSFLGDGSFFAWGEGMARKPVDLEAKDPLSVSLQQYFDFTGSDFQFLRSFWQAFWLVVLLLVAAPFLLRDRRLFGAAASVVRLTLLALVVFLLLFEARSRYLYMYIPFFILLASLTVSAAMRRVKAVEAAETASPPPSAGFGQQPVRS